MQATSLRIIGCLGAFTLSSSALAGGSANFSQPSFHYAGDGPSGVAVGDFTGDGHLDVVSVNHWGHSITAFKGGGDGTLTFSGEFPTTNYPDAIAAGDLDGDGFADVVTVGEYNSNVLAVFRNKGHSQHIRFHPFDAYPVGDAPDSVATGDFDGDGNLDVAVGNRSSRDVSILLGNGDGTLQPEQRYTTTNWPRALVPADLNNDGDLDIAAVSPGGVIILLNNGDGSFAAPLHFAAGEWSYDLDVADFNGDGFPDIAVANFYDGDVSVILGNGDGTFQPRVILPVDESNLERIVTGDFTGDGNDDIVVINGFWHTISVLPGHGDGTFRPKEVFQGGSMQRGIEKGDIDGDGDLDLFVAHLAADRVSVLINLAPPSQGVPADLVGVEVVLGSLISGGLNEIRQSNGEYLHTRSAFGFSAAEPNVMELRAAAAATAIESPATLDVTIESRINNPGGTARVRLRNWDTGLLEQVYLYSIGQTEEIIVVPDIPAATYVREAGATEIELAIRHIVIATFSLSGFDSYFDWIEIGVN